MASLAGLRMCPQLHFTINTLVPWFLFVIVYLKCCSHGSWLGFGGSLNISTILVLKIFCNSAIDSSPLNFPHANLWKSWQGSTEVSMAARTLSENFLQASVWHTGPGGGTEVDGGGAPLHLTSVKTLPTAWWSVKQNLLPPLVKTGESCWQVWESAPICCSTPWTEPLGSTTSWQGELWVVGREESRREQGEDRGGSRGAARESLASLTPGCCSETEVPGMSGQRGSHCPGRQSKIRFHFLVTQHYVHREWWSIFVHSSCSCLFLYFTWKAARVETVNRSLNGIVKLTDYL